MFMTRALYRCRAGLLLTAAGFILLAWGLWPAERLGRVEPVRQEDLLAPGSTAGIQEVHRVVVEWPAAIHKGDTDDVQLVLKEDESAKSAPAAAGQDAYSQYNILAEARLDLPDAAIAPPAESSEPLAPAKKVTFTWKVQPRVVGELEGTLWLYLSFIPQDGGTAADRRVISTQRLKIPVNSLLGLSGSQVRITGGLLLAVGLLLAAEASLFRPAGHPARTGPEPRH
jgi:hypothetical protein